MTDNPMNNLGGGNMTGETEEPALVKVAKGQKSVLWFVLLLLVLNLASTRFPLIGVAGLVVGIIGCILVYRLAKALGMSVPWLIGLLLIIPFVGIGVLLILNSRATRTLKDAGFRVGLMGADVD